MPKTDSVLVLENVTVIDGTGAPAQAGMSVVVTGERISAVGTADSVPAISSPGAETIDASGRFLIPGLWDMHVHLGGFYGGTRAGPAFIAHGVTGVRDMASPLDEILTLRDRWRTASPSGPRLIAAGPILQGPLPFEMPLMRNVDSPAEARSAVDDLHRAGVDFIKVGDTVPPDAYKALVDQALRHDLPVAGHLPVGIGAADAALAGQRSIEHFGSARFHGLLLAASSDEGALTRRVQALFEAARQGDAAADTRLFGADLTGSLADSFSRQKAAALFRTFVDRGTAHVPTLGAVRSVWDAQADGMTERDRRAADRVWVRYREMVRLMRDADVPILAGTDQAPHGASLHRELELFVEAGLSPMEAIEAATSQATAFLGLLEELGTVEAGKRADLVLLDGDPLADIENTRRIAAVIVGGVVLNHTELQGLATYKQAFPHWLWIGVLCAAALLARMVISRQRERSAPLERQGKTVARAEGDSSVPFDPESRATRASHGRWWRAPRTPPSAQSPDQCRCAGEAPAGRVHNVPPLLRANATPSASLAAGVLTTRTSMREPSSSARASASRIVGGADGRIGCTPIRSGGAIWPPRHHFRETVPAGSALSRLAPGVAAVRG